MAKVAIVGAGRVGTAAAKILLTVTDHEVVLIDSSEDALTAAFEACAELERPQYLAALTPTMPLETFVAYGKDQLEATLRATAPALVICSTPFSVNIMVAEIANRVGCHYIDFTEDNSVTAAINELSVSRLTFVPQTGLAPGLVNYLGLSLFEELGEPLRLDLRVGALPQVSFGPAHYAVTWSVEGLVNEYLKPTYVKNQGTVEETPPLDEHEMLVVNGVSYEGFTTSGGVGMLTAYDHVPSVQYKTLRFPGHLDFLQKILSKVNFVFEDAVDLFKQTFVTTRDDVVVLVAHAVDTEGKSASAGLHFYPAEELGLTALELTTAGVGIGVAELILSGELDAGVLNASQIPFEKLMATSALRLVFDHLN
jgi:saccharopine dehydrogenase-like NADP-dependent oxidoreductase